jgi:hypothetical protein
MDFLIEQVLLPSVVPDVVTGTGNKAPERTARVLGTRMGPVGVDG